MNIKDFRAAAYQKNSELPKNEQNLEQQSTIPNVSIRGYQTQKKQNQPPKQSQIQQLQEAADLLKSGGLLKVPVEKPDSSGKDSVYRRVAKFLLLIGEDEAAKILPHLQEDQIEKIIPEIASIRSVSNEEAAVILEEFNALTIQTKTQGGFETAKEMLEKAYGKKRAAELLQKTVPNEGRIPFDYLNQADNERIYLLLKDENIGVQTMVLSRINPKKAAFVINLMKPDEKKQIVLRLAKMDSIDSDILRRVDQAMYEKFQNQVVEKADNIDGRNALAQILKKMDLSSEREILSNLSKEDKDLGEDRKSRLFTLEDAVNADDRYIQNWLAEHTIEEIAYLIAAKPQDFREKILQNVSSNRRIEILEQEDILKPMPKSLCSEITEQFFAKLRNSFEKGELLVAGRNQQEFI